MKRIKIGLVVIIGCFFLLGLSGSVYASPDWSLLNEPFDVWGGWNDLDSGSGVSQISPAGYLDQAKGAGGLASISQDIGTIGIGDYTIEYKVKLVNITGSLNRLNCLGATGWLAIDLEHDGIRIYDGAGFSHWDYTWDTGIYNTIRYIVHTNQTAVDVYINGNKEIENADCSASSTIDGYVGLRLQDANTHWSIDYLRIDDGQQVNPGYPSPIPEPGTMMLLGSLATGLFGITRIRKKRKGGEKNMRDVSFSKIKTTSLLAALVIAGMLLWGNVAFAVPTAATDWAGLESTWGSGGWEKPSAPSISWYELVGESSPNVPASIWIGEISDYNSCTSTWTFEYALWNENYTPNVGNFKVWTSGFNLTNIGEPANWTHTDLGDCVQWTVTSSTYRVPVNSGTGLFSYQVIGQGALWGLVDASSWNGTPSAQAPFGKISGPVPEPSTMMLLGSLATGLFGIAAVRKRRS